MGSKANRHAVVALYVVIGVAAAAVLFRFAPEEYGFYPRCTLFALTGLQCPGCGGLRATHHLLHGDLSSAWQLNPMVFVLLPLLGLFFGAHIFQLLTDRRPAHPFRHANWLWMLAGLCLLFAILRNLPLLFPSQASG